MFADPRGEPDSDDEEDGNAWEVSLWRRTWGEKRGGGGGGGGGRAVFPLKSMCKGNSCLGPNRPTGCDRDQNIVRVALEGSAI